MASKNKKNKARNSYMINGAEKHDAKIKRVMYYTKRERKRIKNTMKEESEL